MSKCFWEALINAKEDKKYNIFRRSFESNGVTYCFLFQDDLRSRDHRKAMLTNMCFIARGKYKENRKVVDIATEKYKAGLSYDFYLIDIPKWTEENQKTMEDLQRKTNIFNNPILHQFYETEYPEKQSP